MDRGVCDSETRGFRVDGSAHELNILGAWELYHCRADGIFNFPLRDFDDVDLIKRNMVCSLKGTSCASQ